MLSISFIVPVHNAEEYLPACIDSLLGQTGCKTEILLVDDGSTDASSEICDSYARKYADIRVFHKANGGVSSARNLGTANASGEWIWFVDADDVLEDGALAEISRYHTGLYDCFMTGYRRIRNGQPVCDGKDEPCQCIKAEKAMAALYEPLIYPYEGYIWNKIFRKSIIDKAGLRFDETVKFNEDRQFSLAFFLSMEKDVLYDPRPFYRYCVRPSGAMESTENKYNPDYITDLHSLLEMKEMLARHGCRSLLPLARRAILISADYNLSMLLNHGVDDIPKMLYILRTGWKNWRITDLAGRKDGTGSGFFKRNRKVFKYLLKRILS